MCTHHVKVVLRKFIDSEFPLRVDERDPTTAAAFLEAIPQTALLYLARSLDYYKLDILESLTLDRRGSFREIDGTNWSHSRISAQDGKHGHATSEAVALVLKWSKRQHSV